MKYKIIMIPFILMLILVAALILSAALSIDPLTYGQVISKEYKPEVIVNEPVYKLSMSGITTGYSKIYYPEEFIVIIEGRSKSLKIKQKVIYLNQDQYNNTVVGGFVDIGVK